MTVVETKVELISFLFLPPPHPCLLAFLPQLDRNT